MIGMDLHLFDQSACSPATSCSQSSTLPSIPPEEVNIAARECTGAECKYGDNGGGTMHRPPSQPENDDQFHNKSQHRVQNGRSRTIARLNGIRRVRAKWNDNRCQDVN